MEESKHEQGMAGMDNGIGSCQVQASNAAESHSKVDQAHHGQCMECLGFDVDDSEKAPEAEDKSRSAVDTS